MSWEQRHNRRPTPGERWIALHPFRWLVFAIGAPLVAFLAASMFLPGFFSWEDLTTVVGMFGTLALTGVATSRRRVSNWPTPA